MKNKIRIAAGIKAHRLEEAVYSEVKRPGKSVGWIT